MSRAHQLQESNPSVVDDDVPSILKDRRTASGTKKQYVGKVNAFLKWATDHERDVTDEDGHIAIPSAKKNMLDFFGYMGSLATERLKLSSGDDFEDGPVPYSSSHLKGFKSALVDLYR